MTIERTEAQRADLAAKVAHGGHASLEAAIAAAIDEAAEDEEEAMAPRVLDDPAFVGELGRRADDLSEMFDEFNPEEMMERIRGRRAVR